ncbi:MAG: methyltransferase domain-containing protein [Isosphaeraceae bacterium]|nr:methyltransferase domain-containing protein [Isosphaeraceae bacterium]
MGTGLTLDQPVYFDRLAEIEATHWWARGMWRLTSLWLDEALQGRRGLRVLDVGCGTGWVLSRFRQRGEVAWAIGVDPSPVALARARRYGEGGLARGDARSLPFADRSFDMVTCFDVLQHLDAGGDRQALRELRRVLRPGGLALIRANGRGWARGHGERAAPYRLRDLTRMLEDSGLAVRRATYANCLPALAQELRGRLRPSSGHRSHPAGGGLQIWMPPPWWNRLMGAVATAEAMAAGRWGVRLPFGHSTLVLAGRE